MCGRYLLQMAAGGVSAGAWWLAGRSPSVAAGILLYHRVSPLYRGAPRPTQNVRPQNFRRQLEGLLRLGYRFWPLSRVLQDREAGREIPPQTVVLTFDDGYANNFSCAWPIMRDLQVPGTIFVSTAYLDREEPFPFEAWDVAYADRVPPEAWRPLTRGQCRDMLASGLVELGAHTHTHEDFRGRPAAFAADLQTSVTFLRSEFGIEDVTFAFPYGKPLLGYTDEELVRAARRVGVSCSLTAESDSADPAGDPFQWGRFNVYDWDTPSTLAAKLAGYYRWATRLKGRLTRQTATPVRFNEQSYGVKGRGMIPADGSMVQ